LDHFFCKNGPNDLFRGLFSSLDIGTYFPPTYGPLGTFLGPFGGAQTPQNSIKNNFLVVLDNFFYYNGPDDLVRGLFSNLDIGILKYEAGQKHNGFLRASFLKLILG
jgi:hypothetical protein